MSHLYNCKSDGDHYRISKFSNDLDVEASYLTNGSECNCPAGHRPVCRHRIMLPRFIAKNATAGQWFHNYEANQWIRALAEDESDTLGDLASAASEVDTNYGTGPMMEAVYDLRADQARDITPKPINLLELAKPAGPYNITATEIDEQYKNMKGPEHKGLEPVLDKMFEIARSVEEPTEPKPLRRL